MKKDDKDDPFARKWWEPKLPNGGASWACFYKRPEPEREPLFIKEPWPAPKERTDKVFAKCCDLKILQTYGRTHHVGTTTMPASAFGKVMISGSLPIPAPSQAASTAIGANTALGYMGPEGIMQQGMSWVLRLAGGPARVLLLAMLPTKMGDGTLHTNDELRTMTRANSRVRFQFRQDAEGIVQVYGIHTGPSGDQSVPTVQVQWTDTRKKQLEAELNGITILWTPKHELPGLGFIPYPNNHDLNVGSILVHPIPENVDSEIEGLPGEDITIEDRILVFPANSGMDSLYVMYAKPPGAGAIRYHKPPDTLSAFPDAVDVRHKGTRRRWESKKRIYEWDYQHGAVEMYDKQGNHLGEFDASTGEQTGKARPERRITTK